MNISQDPSGRLLLSGNEAVALAALHCGVALGTGYPGTPSTEILEAFGALGGKAQWAPNEKVAAEVALGAAFAHARVLCTMKHVGLNVAADVLFTMTYSGVDGGYVLAVADDPGMASSQNEQDSRRYAEAAGAPMFEPADSQEAYDLLRTAYEVSERWHIPVLFRLTTRVSHSKSPVRPRLAVGAALSDTGRARAGVRARHRAARHGSRPRAARPSAPARQARRSRRPGTTPWDRTSWKRATPPWASSRAASATITSGKPPRRRACSSSA